MKPTSWKPINDYTSQVKFANREIFYQTIGQRTLILRITSLSGSVIFSSSLFVGRIRGKKTKNKKQKNKIYQTDGMFLIYAAPRVSKVVSTNFIRATSVTNFSHKSDNIALPVNAAWCCMLLNSRKSSAHLGRKSPGRYTSCLPIGDKRC